MIISCETPVDLSGGGSDQTETLDSDGDGVSDSSDCAPNDSEKFRLHTAFVDSDGDAYGEGASVTVCSNQTLPTGYVENMSAGEDCDSSDSSKYRNVYLKTDNDEDGYGVGSSSLECIGATVPSLHTSNTSNSIDCDDDDDSAWLEFTIYRDRDFDGIGDFSDSAQTSCESGTYEVPSGYSSTLGGAAYCSASRNSNSPFANSDESGIDGSTKAKAYTICTNAQLQNLVNSTANWASGLHYRLMSDLDLNDVSQGPIGLAGLSFKGSFDGNFKTISNLRVVQTYSFGSIPVEYIGLFGHTDGATIENLFINSTIVYGPDSTGVLIGDARNSIIKNISIRSSTAYGRVFAGSVFGSIEASQVENIYSDSVQVRGLCTDGNILNTYLGLFAGEIRGAISPDAMSVSNVVIRGNSFSNSHGFCMGSTSRMGLIAGKHYRVPEINLDYSISSVILQNLGYGVSGERELIHGSIYKMFTPIYFHSVGTYSGLFFSSGEGSYGLGFSDLGHNDELLNSYLLTNSDGSEVQLSGSTYPSSSFLHNSLGFDADIWQLSGTNNFDLDETLGRKNY